MKAKLMHVSSPDIELPALYDTDLDLDSALLEFIIGPEDSEDGESFGVELITARYLADLVTTMPVPGRHRLVMERINVSGAVGAIMPGISALEERSWPDLALKIARIGAWEFEDYREE